MFPSEHSTNQSELAVSASNVNVNLNGRALLRNVSLSLPPYGISVVMGYNGAGKSLLLRVLHRLIQVSDGAVSAPKHSDGCLAQQAMVFQKPTLLRRSVSSNLKFTMKLRQRFSKSRHDELLDKVGIRRQATQPARSLSGGEQQRLAMACALSLQPDILFLDEPTASLDPYSAQIIEELLKEVSSNQTKVVLVTHDVAQAMRLANDVVFVHQGSICEHQRADQFFAAPSSAAARAYLQGQLYV